MPHGNTSEDYWYFENITVGPFDVYIEGGWSAIDDELYFICADVGGVDDGSFNVCFDRQVGIEVVRAEVRALIRRRLKEWSTSAEKII